MKSVGIIGFGIFGRFMAGHLAQYAEVLVYDIVQRDAQSGVNWTTLDDVLRQPVIILAVPVQELEELLVDIGSRVQPDALVIDVASVKVAPVKLMMKYLPQSCRIMATHPLFGPVSGASGIVGLTIVTWPVRLEDQEYAKIKAFLSDKLKLSVIETSPEDHDKEMAYVQALTFLVGRALTEMKLPDSRLKTATYQHMLDIERVVASGTPELFETIQKYNPYAKAARDSFIKELVALEWHLGDR